MLLSSDGLGELYIGSSVCFLSPLARFKSQRRFLLPLFTAHASYNLSSFGIPRMIFIYLGRFRPRHVRRPSAAHSRFGGEVHVCRKVWQTRKVTIRTLYWLYSRPSFAAPTINWSWRGSYSAGYALLYSRGTYSKWCFAVNDASGQYHSKSS